MKNLNISLVNIPLTLDSGFDSEHNSTLIKSIGMIPIIKPNFRNTKDEQVKKKRTDEFEKLKDIYLTRFTVERGFAWEDKYRKLVIRYERLSSTFNGFRYLASAMINYRGLFGKSL